MFCLLDQLQAGCNPISKCTLSLPASTALPVLEAETREATYKKLQLCVAAKDDGTDGKRVPHALRDRHSGPGWLSSAAKVSCSYVVNEENGFENTVYSRIDTV